MTTTAPDPQQVAVSDPAKASWKGCYAASGLENWISAEPLPPMIARHPKRLKEALTQIEVDVAPVTARAMAVIVGQFLDFANTFQLGGAWEPEKVAADYRGALAELPGALIALGFKRLQQTWHWRSLPLPGDVRQAIAPETEQIWRAKSNLSRAAHRLKLDELSRQQREERWAREDAHRKVSVKTETAPKNTASEPVDLTPEERAKKLAEWQAAANG